jgi:hypothetical protein
MLISALVTILIMLDFKKGGIMQGIEPILQRKENAKQRFIEDIIEQFGKTKEEAEKVLAVYLSRKVVKLDGISGQFELKSGALWEKNTIDFVINHMKG